MAEAGKPNRGTEARRAKLPRHVLCSGAAPEAEGSEASSELAPHPVTELSPHVQEGRVAALTQLASRCATVAGRTRQQEPRPAA